MGTLPQIFQLSESRIKSRIAMAWGLHKIASLQSDTLGCGQERWLGDQPVAAANK